MKKNYQKVSEDFAVTSQIHPEDLNHLASIGFKTIVNNRPDQEDDEHQPLHIDLKQQAEKLGLEYVYLPVKTGQITQEHIHHMSKALKESPKPIVAFCKTGARSNSLYLMARHLKT